MEYISKSLEDTEKIAIEIANRISLEDAHRGGAAVLGLYGELGAGKTTFMKYFAKALGVQDEVQSPTFVLMKFFNMSTSSFSKLVHIDAYRLDNGEDLKKLGWDELLGDPKNLICIEWPERVAEIMPEHFVLRFEHVKGNQSGGEENARKISFT